MFLSHFVLPFSLHSNSVPSSSRNLLNRLRDKSKLADRFFRGKNDSLPPLLVQYTLLTVSVGVFMHVRGSMALFLLTLRFSPLPLQNNNFVVNQRKFWELIDSWHKDCQQAMPLGLADPRVCYLFIFAFPYSIKYPPDSLVSEVEKKKRQNQINFLRQMNWCVINEIRQRSRGLQMPISRP